MKNTQSILVLYHDGDWYLPKLSSSLWTWHSISCRQKCPARTEEERKVKNGKVWDLNILALKCTKLEHVCRGGFEISPTSTLLSQPSRSASGPTGLPAVKGAAMCFFTLLTCTCVPTHAHNHAYVCCEISQQKRVNIKCEIAFLSSFYPDPLTLCLWNTGQCKMATSCWSLLPDWVNLDMKVSKMTLQSLSLFCVLFFKLEEMAYLQFTYSTWVWSNKAFPEAHPLEVKDLKAYCDQ